MIGKKLKIGSQELQSNVLLSPMEGASDVGFRELCYKNGAGITWTEMTRASGIVRKNKATLELIDTFDTETCTGIQLFVINECELKKTLEQIELLAKTTMPHMNNVVAIDLNFGCPSPDVIGVGAGPALLKRTTKMTAIFKTLHDWKQQTPLKIGAVGAKIRLGLNKNEQQNKIYMRIVPAANDYLDYLTVHARHAQQRSKDPPAWSAIREVKEQSSIPIIGNGDVFSRDDAKHMFSETQCDGIMIARAALQNPWIFKELTGQETSIPTREEILQAQDAYLITANRYHTKQKYLEFHKQNFERLLQEKSSHGNLQQNLPKNKHIL